MKKMTTIFLGLCLLQASLRAETKQPLEVESAAFWASSPRPKFDDKEGTFRISPFLIPSQHPAKIFLDRLLSSQNILKNEAALLDAGFVRIAQDTSSCLVAKHPDLPGYVFKVYLCNEHRKKQGVPSWEALVMRCESAAMIRKIISEYQLKHFAVPDKWLYPIPLHIFESLEPEDEAHLVILVATDMDLYSREQCAEAWMTLATPELLDELFFILQHGYGCTQLVKNLPYTHAGKFAFVDTEYPKRLLQYEKVKRFLNPSMADYWDSLIQTQLAP